MKQELKVKIRPLYTVVEVEGPTGRKVEMRQTGELGPIKELRHPSDTGGHIYVMGDRGPFSELLAGMFGRASEHEVVAGAPDLLRALTPPEPAAAEAKAP